jgi:hypothetical protein
MYKQQQIKAKQITNKRYQKLEKQQQKNKQTNKH